ncbi:MAG: hypothetical protein ACI8RO_002057, partial [Flavobacteriales bacterium]
PDSIQECYNKHQDLASSSAVAKAIYRACDDYNYRPSQIPARWVSFLAHSIATVSTIENIAT